MKIKHILAVGLLVIGLTGCTDLLMGPGSVDEITVIGSGTSKNDSGTDKNNSGTDKNNSGTDKNN